MALPRCRPEASEETLAVSATDACTTDPSSISISGVLVSVNGTALSNSVSIDGSDPRIVLPVGTSVVSWTATDANGNSGPPVLQTITVEIADTPEVCCDHIATAPIVGNQWSNFYLLPFVKSYCVFGMGGVDTITTGRGPDLISGGDSWDVLSSGSADDVVLGRAGGDLISGKGTLYGGPGNDVFYQLFGGVIYGNAGDDNVDGLFGDHVVYPGSGRDFVRGGTGDDTVIVYDACELEPFEVLDGGFGYDTLVIPIPLADVIDRGVFVLGFNNIVVDDSKRHLADCF